ncbi:transcription elongation factor, mitochondrial-like [Megaptera novaeangliae]
MAFSDVSRLFQSSRFLSHAQPANNDLGFKTSYDNDQTSRILKIVNTSSVLELKNYQISHQRIQRILKRREAKGHFESIEDLLEVDGFGIKILEKFCNSIINSKPEENSEGIDNDTLLKPQPESTKRPQFLTPALLEVIRSKVNTVVSFHIDLNYFAWTKFYYDRQANEELEEPKYFIDGWNCYEFAKQEKNLRLTDLIELLVKFNDRIPEADVYTIESLPVAVQAKQPGSALQVNINIQKTQLTAMLSILMASRRSVNKMLASDDCKELNLDTSNVQETPYIDSVYFLRNFLPSRFYKILIGNERVSAANVINEIITYNYTVHNKFDPTFASVNIPEEYREFWKNSNRIHQEYLGSSMLAGLTFLKLCIDRCPGSLERLNSRVKKN